VQILLESHSEHLLRRLQRRLAEEEVGKDDIALYFCENEEGASTLKRLETDIFGAIKNWPDDFFGDLTGDIVSAIDAGYERKKAIAVAS
jgi:predicted ATPase